MSTTILNFKLLETWQINCTVRDGRNRILNIANSQILFNMANNSTNNVVLSINTSSGITITNASAGQFSVVVSPNQQANLSEISYRYEIKITLTDGTVGKPFDGNIILENTIT